MTDNYSRRWCRIHGEPEHLHRAVCSACFAPLTIELLPETCSHPPVGDFMRWRCWEGLNS